MTREEAIKALKEIRDFCEKQESCIKCPWSKGGMCFTYPFGCHWIFKEMEIKDGCVWEKKS